MWSYWFCDTRTGDRQLQVEPSGGSWERFLNVAAGGSHTFELAGRDLPRETWWDLTTPWARTLVQCWNDIPVYAGLITGRPYSWGSKRLTVNHTDFRSIFLARYPFGVKSYWSDGSETVPGRLALSGLSWRAIAARVVQEGIVGPTANYSLPVVLPSTTEPGAQELVSENFNFEKVADLLEKIQSSEGGPDIEFSPRWSSAGKLEWVMRAGALTGGLFEFNLTAEKNGVTQFSIAEDALKQVTGVFGVGQGSGADMIVGGTPGGTVADIPARDDVVNYRSAKTAAEAASLAREYRAAHWKGTWQPSISVTTEVDPTTLILGSAVNVYDMGDPWNPDGWQSYRLMGVKGGVGDKLELVVQGVR